MARTWGRKGRPFVRAQQQCFREETHCCICGEWVDQRLPNYRSSKARSVHHLIPPDIAPELANSRDNMRLAHIGCNSREGRGRFEGQGTKGGRISRGRTRRPVTRGYTHPRARAYAGAVSTADRDW